jgi:hypothetical protein
MEPLDNEADPTASRTVERIKCLISSTSRDLEPYRRAAQVLIEQVNREFSDSVHLETVSMESALQSGKGETIHQLSEGWANQVDWVLLIVGFYYGEVRAETGADLLSLTECEYNVCSRHRKRCFVFLAGEPGTPKGYKSLTHEEGDLKDWLVVPDLQTDEQRAKIKAFRARLRASAHTPFSSFADFHTELGSTLRRAVADGMTAARSRPKVEPGTPLAELIVKVTPAIRDLTRNILRVTHCKRIHDCLHDVRQEIVRRLRDELIPRWQRAITLDIALHGSISARAVELSRCQGTLEALMPALPASEHDDLRRQLGMVLAMSSIWDPERGPFDLDAFTENVGRLAIAVEGAFTQADAAMGAEGRTIKDRHERLYRDIETTRRGKRLSRADNKRLDQHMEAMDALTSRLCAALDNHNRWQSHHNALELLEGFRGLPALFKPRLENFAGARLGGMAELLRVRMASCGGEQAPAAAAGDVATLEFDLQEALARLSSTPDDDSYVAARRAFDKMFYRVDKETLDEVTAINTRAQEIEQLVDQLDRSQPKADEPGAE